MKTLTLSKEYKRISHLAKEDRHLFTKLLKGGKHERFLRDLLIAPIHIRSIITCVGFAIEHHQLFRSEASGEWYLVFWPLKYNRTKHRKHLTAHYYVGFALHRINYMIKDYEAYTFGDGYCMTKFIHGEL